MRNKGKKGYGLYAFLEASRVLENGTETEIAEVKKQYWNKKKREWKKQKLEDHKRFEIYLNPYELKLVQKNAAECNVSVTKYIRQIALQPKQAISDEVCGQIRQSLMQAHCAIEELLEENNVPAEISEMATKQMCASEREVLGLLMPRKA